MSVIQYNSRLAMDDDVSQAITYCVHPQQLLNGANDESIVFGDKTISFTFVVLCEKSIGLYLQVFIVTLVNLKYLHLIWFQTEYHQN